MKKFLIMMMILSCQISFAKTNEKEKIVEPQIYQVFDLTNDKF